MSTELTPEQRKSVEDLVAQGWDRTAAEVMVLESTPDVIDEDEQPSKP